MSHDIVKGRIFVYRRRTYGQSLKQQLKPLVITALHTGFRLSELLSLTWNNVDFQHRLITVEAGYSKNGGARKVPMNNFLTETLKAVKKENSESSWVYTTKGKR